MMPNTTGTGASTAMPDVCEVPPFSIPATFPNNATNATAVPSYYTVMINGMPELNSGGTCAISNGDEGGTLGGVASNTIIGPARPTMGSTKYMVGGLPSWRTLDTTVQNTANSVGFSSVPSQTTKIVMR